MAGGPGRPQALPQSQQAITRPPPLPWPSLPQYDQSVGTFSPDGRVFQTDYAQKAVDSSGCARRRRRQAARACAACREGLHMETGYDKPCLLPVLAPVVMLVGIRSRCRHCCAFAMGAANRCLPLPPHPPRPPAARWSASGARMAWCWCVPAAAPASWLPRFRRCCCCRCCPGATLLLLPAGRPPAWPLLAPPLTRHPTTPSPP